MNANLEKFVPKTQPTILLCQTTTSYLSDKYTLKVSEGQRKGGREEEREGGKRGGGKEGREGGRKGGRE